MLTFLPGETTKYITVTIYKDHTYEDLVKKFEVFLTNPSGGASIAKKNCIIEIYDDNVNMNDAYYSYAYLQGQPNTKIFTDLYIYIYIL